MVQTILSLYFHLVIRVFQVEHYNSVAVCCNTKILVFWMKLTEYAFSQSLDGIHLVEGLSIIDCSCTIGSQHCHHRVVI